MFFYVGKIRQFKLDIKQSISRVINSINVVETLIAGINFPEESGITPQNYSEVMHRFSRYVHKSANCLTIRAGE
jgi:hypothetical protein